jgi:hypothetical protein
MPIMMALRRRLARRRVAGCTRPRAAGVELAIARSLINPGGFAAI